MTELPLVDDAIREAAVHGSWCPKLCSHACPVLAATGRNDAVPWGFHRAVVDLADGRLDAASVRDHLALCSGCLACQVPCAFDQDVPAQVREGRSAVARAGAALPALTASLERLRAGRSPYDVDAPTPAAQAPASPEVALLVGCRDDAATVGAAVTLLAAAGVAAAVVTAPGCCGGAIRDLGGSEEADRLAGEVIARLGVAGGRAVALDPHCLGELSPLEPVDVLTFLAGLLDDGRLTFDAVPGGRVVYHDPCLLARGPAPVTDAPRRLLAAAGYEVVEPEGTGAHTVCSGAGLGLELVDPAAAEATASHRRARLRAVPALPVTACSGARRRLAADGTEIADLLILLADRTPRNDP